MTPMPETPPEAALSLSALVVQTAAHTPLTPAQRRFNELLARIEVLTAQIQALEAWSDRHRYAHIQNLRESQQLTLQHRKSLLFLLHEKVQTAGDLLLNKLLPEVGHLLRSAPQLGFRIEPIAEDLEECREYLEKIGYMPGDSGSEFMIP
jgi:hypothetical protein